MTTDEPGSKPQISQRSAPGARAAPQTGQAAAPGGACWGAATETWAGAAAGAAASATDAPPLAGAPSAGSRSPQVPQKRSPGTYSAPQAAHFIAVPSPGGSRRMQSTWTAYTI